MLFPKKVKFRKWQTARKLADRRKSPDSRGLKLRMGEYGLRASSQARITSNSIESARKVLTREIGKYGKYWIRVFPDRPLTKKPAELGMGKGKGDPYAFCADVKPGRILFEVGNVSEPIAREALRKAGTKLPIRSKVVSVNELR